jgi:hypothetical protein
MTNTDCSVQHLYLLATYHRYLLATYQAYGVVSNSK